MPVEFGLDFFPDMRPSEKSGQEYFAETLRIAQECEALGSSRIKIVDDRIDEFLRNRVGTHHGDPSAAGLAVNADADFHFVVGNIEGRLSDCGNSAARQRHTHLARHAIHGSAEVFQRGKVVSSFRCCTHHLFDDHGSGHAAPARAVR